MKRALVATVVAFLAVALASGQASAASGSQPDPQSQLTVIEQIRAQLGSNLADALAAQQQLQQSLQDNATQQAQVQQQIADAQAQIDALDVQIADHQRREAILQQRIDTERAQLQQLARAVYESPDSTLVMLAESKSLGDLFSRIANLDVAGNHAADLKRQMGLDLQALQEERKQEQAARDEQVTLRTGLQTQLAQLKALQAEQEKSMADLEVKIEQTRYEMAVLQRQSTQLAQAVTDMLQQQQDAIIAAAMQSVWAQLQLWLQSNSVGQIQASAGHSTKYRFIWPEPSSQISQPFGPSTYWFEPPYGSYPHFHTGIDMVEPFGSPVFAADDGIVALVGSSGSGYGNYVVIAHAGGFDTLYGHLSTALVKAGQTVTQGTPVGLEGSTGNSTGAHLHFELRVNGRPVDPTPYLPPGMPSAYRG